MTERERKRLIGLINAKQVYGIDQDQPRRHDMLLLDNEDLAEYLLANGVIVPPCKVGDKLYAISDIRIEECTCYELAMHDGFLICADFNCDYDCKGCPFSSWAQDYSGEYSCRGECGDWFFSSEDFGKTVFLSREEAEKALERSRG